MFTCPNATPDLPSHGACLGPGPCLTLSHCALGAAASGAASTHSHVAARRGAVAFAPVLGHSAAAGAAPNALRPESPGGATSAPSLALSFSVARGPLSVRLCRATSPLRRAVPPTPPSCFSRAAAALRHLPLAAHRRRRPLRPQPPSRTARCSRARLAARGDARLHLRSPILRSRRVEWRRHWHLALLHELGNTRGRAVEPRV